MQLLNLFHDQSASARSIVDLIVGPSYGLENEHKFFVNRTPFLIAVYAGRLDVVQLLVSEHSVNTKAVDSSQLTALHIGANQSSLMVRYLVEQCGLDINARDKDNHSPLHWAIIQKNNNVALLLLELGADPTLLDKNKYTPLHHSCKYGLVNVTQKLLEKGASPRAVNCEGKTPVDLADLAAAHGHNDLAALFRQ